MAIAFDKSLGGVKDNAILTTGDVVADLARIVMVTHWFDTTATCTGADETGGLTWTVDAQTASFGGGHRVAILSAPALDGLPISTPIGPAFSTGVDFGPGVGAISFTGVELESTWVEYTTTAELDTGWTTPNIDIGNPSVAVVVSMSDGTSGTITSPATEALEWNTEGASRVIIGYRLSGDPITVSGAWTGAGFAFNVAIAYREGEPPASPDVPELWPTTRAGVMIR